MGLCSCSKVEAIKIDIDANGAMYLIDGKLDWPDVEEYIWKLGIGWDKQTEIEGLLNAA